MTKYVYFFGLNETEGSKEMIDKLGGKGAGLAEMSRMNIRVPPGFTIISDVCLLYLKKKSYSTAIINQINLGIEKLEKIMNKKLGDLNNPLLVSVRSGSKVSMPGMMDTVLNLGLNDKSVECLSKKTNNEWFAYDCYRRFISMFGNVVLNIEYNLFEDKINELKIKNGYLLDTELSINDLKILASEFKKIIKKVKGIEFPQDPKVQLSQTIDAVFMSWNNSRAKIYRKLNNISENWGTAVNIQSMVYGNKGSSSVTGVAFTRNPSTGINNLFGEFLINAQGEDVVSGIRTPESIEELKIKMPLAYNQLLDISKKLEFHFKDMQDIEFTIEEEKLYILQTRTGKRTAKAAIKIVVDMVNENLINKATGIMRIKALDIDNLLHPTIDCSQKYTILAKGLPASPGAAIGKIVFSSKKAELSKKNGERVILVRTETSTEDIGGMYASEGFLTTRGGMTSHAAVVGRGIGKPCVVGCNELYIDTINSKLLIKNKVLYEGDYITIDGSTGNVILGLVKLTKPTIDENMNIILSWCDEFKKLKILANADTSEDVQRALELGAEGVGLCRTEHMFFKVDRIPIVMSMILAESENERDIYLDKLLPMQKEDFKNIFKIMDGKKVTIRYLDPPLHEFLPNKEELINKLHKLINSKIQNKEEEIKSLKKLV